MVMLVLLHATRLAKSKGTGEVKGHGNGEITCKRGMRVMVASSILAWALSVVTQLDLDSNEPGFRPCLLS